MPYHTFSWQNSGFNMILFIMAIAAAVLLPHFYIRYCQKGKLFVKSESYCFTIAYSSQICWIKKGLDYFLNRFSIINDDKCAFSCSCLQRSPHNLLKRFGSCSMPDTLHDATWAWTHSFRIMRTAELTTKLPNPPRWWKMMQPNPFYFARSWSFSLFHLGDIC